MRQHSLGIVQEACREFRGLWGISALSVEGVADYVRVVMARSGIKSHLKSVTGTSFSVKATSHALYYSLRVRLYMLRRPDTTPRRRTAIFFLPHRPSSTHVRS